MRKRNSPALQDVVDDFETEQHFKIKDILRRYEIIYGEIPQLYQHMADQNPELLISYAQMEDSLSQTSFSAAEKQVIMLVFSIQNKSHLCATIHQEFSCLNDLPLETVQAIINKEPIQDPKIKALVQIVNHIAEEKGHLNKDIIDVFFNNGFKKSQLLSLIHFAATKTITNLYANAIQYLD